MKSKRINCPHPSHWSVCVLLAALLAPAARSGERHQLRNHVPANASNLQALGRLAPMSRLDLTIGLPLRNQEALARLLKEQYEPGSANYRQWLTPEEFAERFGPTEEDYQAVVKFARAQGLIVTGLHSNRTLVNVRGAVKNIERAFNVRLQEFQHPTESRKFFAPDVEPALDLDVPVLAISGLDNFAIPRPCFKTFPFGDKPKPAATGSGPGGYFLGNDFRRAYAPGVSLTGAGQSVALVQFDGYYPQDVAAYLTLAGLPSVPIKVVLLDGFNGSPGGANIEVALDIEMTISMAPGLSQVVVYEGNLANSVLNRIATDRLARQISASWTYGVNATTIQIFQQFAAQGQSFYNASGDDGAYSGPPLTPTDNPYITVVGGTTLTTVAGGGAYIRETTWPGSGGGFSLNYVLPVWQEGINMTDNKGSTTFRNLPDVAMIADETFLIADHGQSYIVQGTSIASPLWAGYTALINELAQTNGQPAVGFINPAVYGVGKGSNALSYSSLFHDVTSGNNNAGSPDHFSAVSGYDLCTGWGSPRGSNLITALALPESLRITPGGSATIAGPSGGPFTPATYTYSLTNNSTGGSLSWSLVNTSLWFNVSPTNGTLVPGGPATLVSVSPSTAASNLPAGGYSATIAFTNLNNNFGQTRPLLLAVVTPPVITAQPTNQDLPAGMTARFFVETAPNALLYYQWRKNGLNLANSSKISGSTANTLTVSNITSADGAAYSVVLSNAAGVAVSSNAQLTIVSSAPLIVQQPTNQTILPGAPAAFAVRAVGDSPFSYQWRLNGTNLANSANVSGVTSNILSIKQAAAANLGAYSVSVSNALGGTISAAADLALVPVTVPGLTLSLLWSSPSAPGGQYPYSPITQARDRNFFVTTLRGGTSDAGTLFRIGTNGSAATLLTFTGANGAYPYAGLTLGRDGLLYGSTFGGGAPYNDGVLFKITTAGGLTPLGSFNGYNGSSPVGGLVQASDNSFYGTAYQGGVFGYGTLYRIFPSGSLTALFSFSYANGAFPSGVLVNGTDGFLYGTTENGGTNGGYGTIFKSSFSGALTVLHSFNNSDGAIPVAGVIQATDGNYYGVAYQGGHNDYGTVFRMTPSGAFTTLHYFNGGSEGANPWGGLLQASDGNLYGTTQTGGTYGGGTVFRIAPGASSKLTTIAQFDGYNGAAPSAALIQALDGNLYGTTQIGGTNNTGSIFRLSINGPLEITGQPSDQAVYTGGSAVFTVATFGSSPVSYQWQRDGTNLTDGANIFGSTNATLSLTNVTVADSALYSVVVSNAFNSVTSQEAALEVIISPPHITLQPVNQTRVTGMSASFSVAALGALPLWYQWQYNGTNLVDGPNLSGSTNSTLTLSNLTLANQGLYSVLVSNASRTISSEKALLSIVSPTAPSASFSTLRALNAQSDGAWPYAGLIQASDGLLYGTASGGGFRYLGATFRLSLSGTFTTLYSFLGGTLGASPNASLVQASDGNFYAPTAQGGTYGYGTMFRMTPSGSVIFPFSFNGGLGGANPSAGLALGVDGSFYGTAYGGGVNFLGSAFKITTNGLLTSLHEFAGNGEGTTPYAGLVRGKDGNFYGTTIFGGTYDYGTVFKVTPEGAFSTLTSFDYANGAFPQAGVMQATDGKLYGATFQGGTYDFGTIFSLTTNGTLATVFSFANTNGAYPAASLLQATDGHFYGTTSSGGAGGEGTVFKLTTNGTLTTLVWFDGLNGANSQAQLLQASDGSFYGVTAQGGTGYSPSTGGGNGTIFRVTVPLFIGNPFFASSGIGSLPYAANISTQAVAPPGDLLTFAKLSGPAWLNIAANGALSGTPPNSAIGTNLFVVSLADTNGISASATMKIIINSNPPPSFVSNPFAAPNANLAEYYVASIATNATDPNLGSGERLTFAKVSGPSWLSVAPDGSLSGSPQESDRGTNLFQVSVTDLGGSTVTATLKVYVNSPPIFPNRNFAKPDATAGLSYSGTIAINAADPDLIAGDTLAFYKLSGRSWLNLAANGTISGTPSSADLGTNSFLVLVVDSGGLAATGSLFINVNNNHPPSFVSNPFTAPPASTATPYSATLSSYVTDPDFGDVLTLAKLSGPAWLNVSSAGQLSGTPSSADAGTNSFLISASDFQGASTNATMYINVSSPITLRIARAAAQISLSWTGGNSPYQVQTTTNLGAAAWSDFGSPVSSNNLLLSPTNTSAYFRIRGQ